MDTAVEIGPECVSRKANSLEGERGWQKCHFLLQANKSARRSEPEVGMYRKVHAPPRASARSNPSRERGRERYIRISNKAMGIEQVTVVASRGKAGASAPCRPERYSETHLDESKGAAVESGWREKIYSI